PTLFRSTSTATSAATHDASSSRAATRSAPNSGSNSALVMSPNRTSRAQRPVRKVDHRRVGAKASRPNGTSSGVGAPGTTAAADAASAGAGPNPDPPRPGPKQ